MRRSKPFLASVIAILFAIITCTVTSSAANASEETAQGEVTLSGYAGCGIGDRQETFNTYRKPLNVQIKSSGIFQSWRDASTANRYTPSGTRIFASYANTPWQIRVNCDGWGWIYTGLRSESGSRIMVSCFRDGSGAACHVRQY